MPCTRTLSKKTLKEGEEEEEEEEAGVACHMLP
jgi:hypothetical protein